jgi:hypothetical protein
VKKVGRGRDGGDIGEGDAERGGGGGDAERVAKAFEGAGDALACRLFGDAESGGHVVMGHALIEAEDEGRAIGGWEAADGQFEAVFEVIPGRRVLGRGEGSRVHAFTLLSAAFGAHEGDGAVTRGLKEPAAEAGSTRQCRGLARERQEDALGHVFGEGGVMGEAKGGGVDPVDVAVYQIAEGLLIAAVGVAGEEVAVGDGGWRGEVVGGQDHMGLVTLICRRGGKPDRRMGVIVAERPRGRVRQGGDRQGGEPKWRSVLASCPKCRGSVFFGICTAGWVNGDRVAPGGLRIGKEIRIASRMRAGGGIRLGRVRVQWRCLWY